MKAVILAGGFGSRISEESQYKPKPMIEIGSKPILWHILKLLSFYGIKNFIICCGYKGYFIKEYFSNYLLYNSDVTFNLKKESYKIHKKHSEDWEITLVDTGLNSMTGGRLKRVRDYLDDKPFLFTYGDGLSNVNITNLVKFHKEQKKIATLTAVQPPGRFGALEIINKFQINSFQEKPLGDGSWVNGGYFILNQNVFDYIEDDKTIWEKESLPKLAEARELVAFKHGGFWHPMDTIRDKNYLQSLWDTSAPWKVWND